MIYSWKKIIKNSVPILTIAVIIEIFAGSVLQGNQDVLIFIPIFLISIPVVNSVGGNIGSVLGARLASGLHIGSIEVNYKDKKMLEGLITAIVIGVFTYFVLSIVIYYVAAFSGIQMNISMIEFVAIFVTTGVLLVSVVAIFSILAAFISFKRGLDPDDMVAPIVTTVGDVLGILFLFIMINIGVGI